MTKRIRKLADDGYLKVLVMGVSGSGKSTLGANLARAINARFIEGDDHHSASNQEKMSNGIALTDADRIPWLTRLGSLAALHPSNVVLSCSALKAKYRTMLRASIADLRIVFLELDKHTAHARVAQRTNHAFPASLVDNQFATLESPVGERNVTTIQSSSTAAEQLEAALRWLQY
ncbi:gluconokinase [Burkholderia multivorans]|uniref:gluconokinase n=1 Tax=Burkholderia multivorans TaxID=87883 RepID=UPI0021C0A062|nr:gluconokinase [Burkholderia multivorans]MDR8762374.1 Gluconokinase [Burkholderia multivorans]MDR8766188.1 Gluconokinase [Burkholderia multivorans]MDR8770026.1 Gluconokinase [Burkholderia multivorans]MDR8789743.1 Gluconokinase [Burkholderia multivorans]MDR8794579.1 Gluconokinase [Burkholderia multivorans]